MTPAGKNTAVVSVGSNISPELNIRKARGILSVEQIFFAESSMVRTRPRGFAEQPDFINGAFLIGTELDFGKLKLYLKEIESRLGRVRGDNPDGSRTIDLDLVVFNGKVVDDDFHRYDFVRKAVLELCPGLGHKGENRE